MNNGHIYLIIHTEFQQLVVLDQEKQIHYLINEQNDIEKIYLYARDLNKPRYKMLIKKRKDAGIKHLNDPNAFIKCSNMIDDVYENIHDYNSSRKKKS